MLRSPRYNWVCNILHTLMLAAFSVLLTFEAFRFRFLYKFAGVDLKQTALTLCFFFQYFLIKNALSEWKFNEEELKFHSSKSEDVTQNHMSLNSLLNDEFKKLEFRLLKMFIEILFKYTIKLFVEKNWMRVEVFKLKFVWVHHQQLWLNENRSFRNRREVNKL